MGCVLQTWSEELSGIAQDHAEECQFAFNSDRENLLSDFPSVGENIFIAPGTVNFATDVVSSWTSESVDFNAVTGECANSCTQYTQVSALDLKAEQNSFSMQLSSLFSNPRKWTAFSANG
jgi:hypothetical protein